MITIEMINQANYTLHNLMVTKWSTQDLFSIKWWGEIGFVIISYIFCFSLLDKTRLTKTILFGSLISVFSVVIEIVGCNSNLWAYSLPIYPMIPNIFLLDITVIPLYYMLIYQRAYSWKSYAVWNIGASAFLGFVFSPLVVSLGLVQLIQWNYVNTFLIIAFVGFLAKAVISLIISFEEQYQTKQQVWQTSVLFQPAVKPLDEESDKKNKN
ncbi:hypothetical protein PIPA1_09840 [Pelosinus sp. IPA-1]|nr:hypothetical protein PIPA1_09840 [Pelosinus sp. IPA-1]